ncbi:MAG: hypothetical protein V2I43_19095 [Parvularcula sp.]|nr:hypothetical protein [Parvularcula sp.]
MIARYFGKSERTVRRWEAEEGLPVQRHMHRVQGSIFAWESDLARWQAARSEESSSALTEEAAGDALVVMPFLYHGADAAQAFLAVGFTDELIADLTRIGSLRIISRTSSHALSGRGLSVAEIRKLLKVEHLVEGFVTQSGKDLKVTVQLIDCKRDRSIWSHTAVCSRDTVFAAQAELAKAVADALGRSVPRGDEEERRGRDRYIWETLVRARIEALKWTPSGIGNAIRLLKTSMDEFGPDPGLVSALGRCHLFLRETGADMGEGPMASARECLVQLQRSAPQSWETYHLAGWLAYQRGDVASAIHSLRSAQQTYQDDPDTLALLSYCYLLSGLDDCAAPLIERLLSRDPLTPLNHSLRACQDLFAGRHEAAVRGYEHMCALDPSNALAQLFLVMAMSLAGDREAVVARVEEMAGAADGSPVDRLLHAFADAVRGCPIGSVPHADDMILASTVDMFPRLMAQAHGLSGDQPAALRWLRIAFERGFGHDRFIARHDPSFAALREHEEFRGLCDEMKARRTSLKKALDAERGRQA